MHSWSSPPMYSIGGAIRGEELKTQSNYYTPGPGTYEHIEEGIVKDAYPTWKMGTSQRRPLYNSTNPEVGPGLYEVSKKDVKKYAKKTFSKDKRGQSEFKGSNAVGPGSYFPKKFVKAPPAFSFGYKGEGFGPSNSENIPGPGTYDHKGMFDEVPTQNLRGDGEPRNAFTRTAPNHMTRSKDGEYGSSKVPGPGEHYNADIDNYDFRYFAPTWSFGKSTRDELYNDESKGAPGPGKYNIPTALKTKTGFTILGKSQSKGTTNDTPGPNVYNQEINPLRQTAPAFRIGKAERKDMAYEQEVPGPGSYHKGQGLGNKGAKIGTSVRPPLHSLDGKKQPGPGAYDIPGRIGGNSKYSMGVKSNSKKPTEVFPGPGEYEPFGTTFFEKTNGAVIGESKRPMLYKNATAPGPGAYDVRGHLGGTKSKFGTGARAPLAKVCDEPGPGYYNIPSAIGNVPKYLLPSYSQEKRRVNTDKDASFKGIFG